ncbi:hypothetical protein [Kribbella sp. NPDC048915]|uniref:helix-turn-helix transcriptional regulator n=1 Tax=Kribbella sp. NPDC048915 TaxID=3155148 RepID=UPI0033E6D3B5
MADGSVVDPLDELDAQVARLRRVADELREARGKPVLDGNQVELIQDWPTLLAAYENMQRTCQVQIRALDRGPYSAPPAAQQKLELERLADGLAYRAIYGFEVFESDEVMAVLPALQAAGEVSRVLPQMPMKMVLGDDNMALVALTKQAPAECHLLIRSSGLLDGLIATFEMFWGLAVPMPELAASGEVAQLRAPDRDILMLLAGGATDDMISRRLRISPRTTQRRVRALMDALGAQTRFQAGVQAARRRWI